MSSPSPIPQLTDDLTRLLAQTQSEHGWDGVAHVLEGAMLRLGVDAWAGKAPGSISRLKRIWQALALSEK